jgi:hypothetical protein
MSRRHPYDGPSRSKATYKVKPMTAEEFSAWQTRRELALEQTKRDTAKLREFRRQVRTVGLLEALGVAPPPALCSSEPSKTVRRI